METSAAHTLKRPKPSFFKILIGDYATKLRIPVMFVKKFCSLLPRKAILWVSENKHWRVDIDEESEKELYFTTGWKRFVEENGLENGEFIVFKFVGKSTFKVKMFGKSACEKEVQIVTADQYSDVTANKENQKQTDDQNEREKNTEIRTTNAEEIVSQRKPIAAETQNKRERVAGDYQKERTINGEDSVRAKKPTAEKGQKRKLANRKEHVTVIKEEEADSDRDTNQSARFSKKRATTPNKVEEGSTSNSENPSFRVVLNKCHVKKGLLNISTSFLMENLSKIDNLTLQTSKGVWKVKLIRQKKGKCTYGSLSAGWLSFVRDNNLKAGETCHFEMIKESFPPTFIVHVIKSDE